MCNCEEGMSEKALDYEPIRYLELDIVTKKKSWLEKNGWKERCDFIDGCWRWCKVVDGIMMMCDLAEALNIEYNYIEKSPQKS